MANIIKTQGTELFAPQSISNTTVVVGTAQDVSTKLAATVFVSLGRQSATNFTAGWPNIRIEGSAKSTGNDAWTPLATFQPSVGSSVPSNTLASTVSAGTNVLPMTAVTGFAIGNLVYIGSSSISEGEWGRVVSIGTDLTLEENLTYPHGAGQYVYGQAELWVAQLDLTAIGRIRVVVDNSSSARTIVVRSLMVTGDSLT